MRKRIFRHAKAVTFALFALLLSASVAWAWVLLAMHPRTGVTGDSKIASTEDERKIDEVTPILSKRLAARTRNWEDVRIDVRNLEAKRFSDRYYTIYGNG